MLRFLLILLIIFFLLRMMGRVVIIKNFNDMRQQSPKPEQRPEGHMIIEDKVSPSRNSSAQGEYVDFEEVK